MRKHIRFRAGSALLCLFLATVAASGCGSSPKTTATKSDATTPATAAKPTTAPSGSAPAGTTSATTPAASGSTSPAKTTQAPRTTATPTTMAPTTTAAAAGVGGTLTLVGRDSQLAVTVVSVMDPVAPGKYTEPDPGKHFIGVQLRIVNTGKNLYNEVLYGGAKLVDSDHQQYEPEMFSGSVKELRGSTILPGDTRLGWITFAVPDAAKPERFTLALDYGSAEMIGEWRLGEGTAGDPAPKVTVPTAGAGEAITLAGRDGLSMKVTMKAVADPATGAKYSKPDAGNRFVAVQFEFANAGNVAYSDSPTNGMALIDTVGQVWEPTYEEVTAGPAMSGSVQVAPADSRVGWVVFELPADQQVAKVQVVLDSGFAEQAGEWTLS